MRQDLRKIMLAVLTLGILSSAGLRGVAMAGEERILRAYRTARPPILDGKLADWKGATSVKIEGPPLGGHARHTTVYTLWDERNLYLAFDVHSTKLHANVRTHDGDKLWEDDGIEFLIDAKRHRTKEFLPDDFSYHINILDAVYDDRGTPAGQPDESWNGKARHVVKVLDDFHYVVEVAIPWEEIGLEPKEGLAIGIDFCVNGKDPATGEYVYYDWCGLKVFHDPSGFGELVLAGKLPHSHP